MNSQQHASVRAPIDPHGTKAHALYCVHNSVWRRTQGAGRTLCTHHYTRHTHTAWQILLRHTRRSTVSIASIAYHRCGVTGVGPHAHTHALREILSTTVPLNMSAKMLLSVINSELVSNKSPANSSKGLEPNALPSTPLKSCNAPPKK